MSRPTIDRLSQAELIYELRRWIDTARYTINDDRAFERAADEVMALVLDHQTSALRPHVLHNLGGRRRAWLSQFAATLPESEIRSLMERMG